MGSTLSTAYTRVDDADIVPRESERVLVKAPAMRDRYRCKYNEATVEHLERVQAAIDKGIKYSRRMLDRFSVPPNTKKIENAYSVTLGTYADIMGNKFLTEYYDNSTSSDGSVLWNYRSEILKGISTYFEEHEYVWKERTHPHDDVCGCDALARNANPDYCIKEYRICF